MGRGQPGKAVKNESRLEETKMTPLAHRNPSAAAWGKGSGGAMRRGFHQLLSVSSADGQAILG